MFLLPPHCSLPACLLQPASACLLQAITEAYDVLTDDRKRAAHQAAAQGQAYSYRSSSSSSSHSYSHHYQRSSSSSRTGYTSTCSHQTTTLNPKSPRP